ncbi:hypothetical protein AtubIFM56815_002015 [Aspergillus tubingensis]|uniref:Uncharacterized protein n=1 Tax=Aspergillus tubingensis TaxID=5068 RepID=A0A9W6AVT3_ASPTU|nr:hypothetical protein AtubIFM56815_002015 [Aspergillus tubingensis]
MQYALLGAGTTDAKMGECYSCRFKYGVVTVSQSSSPHSRLVQQAEDTAVDFVHNLKPLRLYFKATGFLHIAGLGCAKGECSLEFRGRRDDIKILKAASCAPSKVHTQEHENQEM